MKKHSGTQRKTAKCPPLREGEERGGGDVCRDFYATFTLIKEKPVQSDEFSRGLNGFEFILERCLRIA
jgi:hypothetical protein